MAWPYTPLTTYIAAFTPSIKAFDLNSIQSAINTLYGSRSVWLGASHFLPVDIGFGSNWVYNASNYWTLSGGGAGALYGTIEVPLGATITAVQARVLVAANGGRFAVHSLNNLNVAVLPVDTQVAFVLTTNAGQQTASIGGLSLSPSASTLYSLFFNGTQAADAFYSAQVTYNL